MFIDDQRSYNKRGEYRGYELTEEQVRSALASASSVKEAARKMHISYPTFKKYCKMYVDLNTGQTLFDKFKNPAGKGVKSKNWDKLKANYYLDRVLKTGQDPRPERVAKLKEIVLEKMLIPQVCNKCGYHERRLTDMKPPLLLSFKNKNKSDWRLENLELLCYNCYFLWIGDPFKSATLKKIEAIDLDTDVYQKEVQDFHQLDQVYLDHLKSLGLDDNGDLNLEDTNLVDYEDEDDGSDLIDLI